MFLIAGIQPKTARLGDGPTTCPHCGSTQAVVERIDHYFSLFFILLIKVKTGVPVVACPRCQGRGSPWPTKPEAASRPSPAVTGAIASACPACGRKLDPAFGYCPFCGQRVRAG